MDVPSATWHLHSTIQTCYPSDLLFGKLQSHLDANVVLLVEAQVAVAHDVEGVHGLSVHVLNKPASFRVSFAEIILQITAKSFSKSGAGTQKLN